MLPKYFIARLRHIKALPGCDNEVDGSPDNTLKSKTLKKELSVKNAF
jgi:hypothetical protein